VINFDRRNSAEEACRKSSFVMDTNARSGFLNSQQSNRHKFNIISYPNEHSIEH